MDWGKNTRGGLLNVNAKMVVDEDKDIIDNLDEI